MPRGSRGGPNPSKPRGARARGRPRETGLRQAVRMGPRGSRTEPGHARPTGGPRPRTQDMLPREKDRGPGRTRNQDPRPRSPRDPGEDLILQPGPKTPSRGPRPRTQDHSELPGELPAESLGPGPGTGCLLNDSGSIEKPRKRNVFHQNGRLVNKPEKFSKQPERRPGSWGNSQAPTIVGHRAAQSWSERRPIVVPSRTWSARGREGRGGAKVELLSHRG